MSDYIPFEIQMEIIKWLPVKPLIQFRLVSQPWKSFIDSSQFIKGYGAHHTQPRSHILSYKSDYSLNELRYILEDAIETFKVQQQEFAPFVVSPLLEQYVVYTVVGACHGLVCFNGFHRGYGKWMLAIWNPSIGKSFGIVVPSYQTQTYNYGFGVCPVASDPTVVKFTCTDNMPCHEVFTMSSGVWNVIPTGHLPRQSIKINTLSNQVVIDMFIYWGAYEVILADDDVEATTSNMVLSFNLITKEFKVLDLPDSLTNKLLTSMHVSVSKLRGSLVVSGYDVAEGDVRCSVWVMEHLSFRKLFSASPFRKLFSSYRILGFRKNYETIFETVEVDARFSTLDVYDPFSQQIKNFGISGLRGSFFVGSYMESLLLLDHLDSHVYIMTTHRNDDSCISRGLFCS